MDDGEWLITNRRLLDRGEARWLCRLGEFDAACRWLADGQNSCVDWLMHHVGMARSTAFEKLQVARALRGRPLLAEAFGAGRISYSAARAMARMPAPDPEVDQAVLTVAERQPLAEVEKVVRAYHAYLDQERPVCPHTRPSLRAYPYAAGLTKIEAVLPEVDAEEFLACLRLFAERAYQAQSAAADSTPEATTDDGAPDDGLDDGVDHRHEESAAADTPPAPSRWASALLDMTRAAAAHTGPAATGADRYLLHAIVDTDGSTTLPDGTVIPGDHAARLACDTSLVVHHYQAGQPLYQSRRSRTWNTAQRRAALIRDGGGCRFPGCHNHIVDLHHHQPWEQGGPTDIDNAYNLCRHHHTLLHQHGYHAEGQPGGQLTFYRPDHTPIGTTTPVNRNLTTIR